MGEVSRSDGEGLCVDGDPLSHQCCGTGASSPEGGAKGVDVTCLP